MLVLQGNWAPWALSHVDRVEGPRSWPCTGPLTCHYQEAVPQRPTSCCSSLHSTDGFSGPACFVAPTWPAHLCSFSPRQSHSPAPLSGSQVSALLLGLLPPDLCLGYFVITRDFSATEPHSEKPAQQRPLCCPMHSEALSA